jgi:ABC-type branched-subunit amino acid transport system ATPase component
LVADNGRRALLTTEGLAAGYVAGQPIVHDLSVSVEAGEVVTIVGPNGAGKSTLLKALVGLGLVFAGTTYLDGADVTNLSLEDRVRRGIGYVPQEADVFGALSVAENLEMGGYLLGRAEIPHRVRELVQLFPQLQQLLRHRADQLSGGERKLLAVARGMMPRPRVLILDEPTANLSPQRAGDVLKEYVRRLADEGVAVLLVEQRVRAALAISDRGYLLVSGRHAVSGTPEELLGNEEFVELYLGGAR